MGKKREKKKQSKHFLGTYTLPSGQTVVGELSLKGPDTFLRLHSDSSLEHMDNKACIIGAAFTGDSLTLIDCCSVGTGHSVFKDRPAKYHADVFPNYVTIGRHHLKPDDACVTGIHFTTTDLPALFYDLDAFGQVINAEPIIDVVLAEPRKLRPIETGQHPLVCYFTGKFCIVEVQTSSGKISVHHQPRQNMGGSNGAFIKNRIVVSIDTDAPITFETAIDRMYEICCFLSIAAGRSQGIEEISITTTERVDGNPQSIAVHPSFRWTVGRKSERFRPHPGDVPLDPINHRAEFDAVLVNWIGRHSAWRVARIRYIECLRKANEYNPERLVAAANMFDILPADAVPPVTTLPDDLAATRDACKQMLRELPRGIDRDSALSALGRLGQPSLPKKVAHRTSIVESKLGERFQDLQLVTSTAVKIRNFYVHGSSDDIVFEKVAPLLPFLTNALEFVFAASDLIEAGWDASRWNSEPKGWGHSFSRFRARYDSALTKLRQAIAT